MKTIGKILKILKIVRTIMKKTHCKIIKIKLLFVMSDRSTKSGSRTSTRKVVFPRFPYYFQYFQYFPDCFHYCCMFFSCFLSFFEKNALCLFIISLVVSVFVFFSFPLYIYIFHCLWLIVFIIFVCFFIIFVLFYCDHPFCFMFSLL